MGSPVRRPHEEAYAYEEDQIPMLSESPKR